MDCAVIAAGFDAFHPGLRGQRIIQKSPTGPAGSLPDAGQKSPTGPAGSLHFACCAAAQICFCIFSVLLWPVFSCSAICGGIPHLAELVSTYLIILSSAWPKL